jgi:chaperonin GroEL (HSP60 family)
MIELSRTQDEECGDGTTSVIILGAYLAISILQFYSCSVIAGEILAQSLSQLERDIHPVVIISAYNKALKEPLEIIKRISMPIDINNDEEMLALIKTSELKRWKSSKSGISDINFSSLNPILSLQKRVFQVFVFPLLLSSPAAFR